MPAGPRRIALLGLLLAGTLTLGACGSDDSSSTGTQATASSTQAAAAGADSAGFCEDYANVAADIVVDMDPSDPAIADRLSQAADTLKAVQPPAEIADDWATLVTFYEQFGQAFGNMDAEDDASIDKVGEALTKLQENAKDLASAATNIGTYAADNC
jgi:hypothetical protein